MAARAGIRRFLAGFRLLGDRPGGWQLARALSPRRLPAGRTRLRQPPHPPDPGGHRRCLPSPGNGRLARDVQLRSTRSGDSVATVSVASDRRDRQADPIYLDLILWRGQAEAAAEHLVKRQAVAFSGRFEPRLSRPTMAARASPTSCTTSPRVRRQARRRRARTRGARRDARGDGRPRRHPLLEPPGAARRTRGRAAEPMVTLATATGRRRVE